MKLVEAAMEEMIQVDTQQFELGAQMPTYRDYLYKSLLTKYGLPGLANSYIEQISARLRRLGADHGNQYASFVMQLLQDE